MIIFVLAAALGAIIRYLANLYLPRRGILLANITGSFIAGSVLTLATTFAINNVVFEAVFGGFAGSLTTYSTVAVTAAEQHINSTGNATKIWISQVGLSITACPAGITVTRIMLVLYNYV